MSISSQDAPGADNPIIQMFLGLLDKRQGSQQPINGFSPLDNSGLTGDQLAEVWKRLQSASYNSVPGVNAPETQYLSNQMGFTDGNGLTATPSTTSTPPSPLSTTPTNQGNSAPPAPGTGIGPGGNQTPDVPSQNLTPPSGPPTAPPGPATNGPDVSTPPAQTTNPPPGTGGYSSTFDPTQQEALSADPMGLARLWMKQHGTNSMSDNPLAAAMLAEASRAQGLFGLLSNTNSGMQPGSGTYAQNFIDFFDKYMKNPVQLSADKAKQLLAQALQSAESAMSGGDQYNYFANALGLEGQAGVGSNGQATQYAPTLADETARIKELLVSALGGSIDPTYLKGLAEGVDRSAIDYQNSVYGSGDATKSFINWMLSNSKAPLGIGAAPAGGQ